MYIALDKENNISNALDDDISKEKEYYCPICNLKVIFKKGVKIQSHFAHKKNSNCSLNTYKSESKEHLEVKKMLYNHFKDKYEQVKLEHIFKTRDSLQIADVYLSDINIGVEYQRSIISYQELQNRTSGYKIANIKLIWLIDINKFIAELKVHNGIIYIRYAPFVDNFLNYHKGCIFFYGFDRENQTVVFYQIWSYNLKKRYAISKKCVYKLKDFSFPLHFKLFKENLTTKFLKVDIENYVYNQLKYDKTVNNKILSMFYNQKISLNNLPSEIGININEQILINTPLLIWQGEMYRLYKENKSYSDIIKYMLNFINVKDSIYITSKQKKEIVLKLLNEYYNILNK